MEAIFFRSESRLFGDDIHKHEAAIYNPTVKEGGVVMTTTLMALRTVVRRFDFDQWCNNGASDGISSINR